MGTCFTSRLKEQNVCFSGAAHIDIHRTHVYYTRQILRRSGIKYKEAERRDQVTVRTVHAAVWGRVIHSCTGAEGGWGEGGWEVGVAASKTGRSKARVPSCTPCMSFLAFEAFCFYQRREKKRSKMETRHLHRFMSFLWNHDSAFGATRMCRCAIDPGPH